MLLRKRPGQPGLKLLFRTRQNLEAGALYTERIVAVCLNEAIEHFDIEAAHLGMEKDVVAAVLVHIAEVPVPLRIIFGGQREEVIIPFHIAMLAGVEMDDEALFSIVKDKRIPPRRKLSR